MSGSDLAERVQIARITAPVNRDDRSCSFGQYGFERPRRILPVSGSISANTGMACCIKTTCPVATNVCGGNTTSSPALTPASTSARWSAEVPLFSATGWLRWYSRDRTSSNSATRAPWLTLPDRSTAAASSIACGETTVSKNEMLTGPARHLPARQGNVLTRGAFAPPKKSPPGENEETGARRRSRGCSVPRPV